jgi:hypothetical protein
VGIAQTQKSHTPKAISKEYAWVVLDPSRDQDWARFLGQYAVDHPNPLLSVIVCRSSQLESSIAALAPRALIRLDWKLAAKARATIKPSPGVSACAIQNIDETVKFWPGGRSLNGAVGNAHSSLPWRLQLLPPPALEPFCFCQGLNL